MKIIKEGKIPELKPLQGRCKNCGTEVEFEVKEAHVASADSEGCYTYFVFCPLCSNRIFGVRQI